MLKYICKRLLSLIPVLFGVTFLVFSILQFTPGDPARLTLGDTAPQSALQEFREQEGLDDPFFIQYFRYIWKFISRGDAGKSYITRLPVTDSILQAFSPTFQLASLAIIISLSLGILCGIISAIKQYSFIDTIITVLAMLGLSIPIFWFGLLLILFFSVRLGWLPSSGFDTWQAMILPALALGLQSVARFTRMTRSSMLEVIRSDYVRTARSKGQSEFLIIFRHALGNALIPVITLAGIQFGILLEGAVLTESIFSIPGIGRLLVESIKMRDYPMIQGCILYIAICFSLVNLLVDILYACLDPRIRSQYR